MSETEIHALPRHPFPSQIAYRLVNGKYPPIAIFDDVADQSDFDALFAVQALTNPRLQNEVGDLNRVPPAERPWGIPGCNYALGPFVHVSPAGSRFSDGAYGVFYCADRMATALAETRYHQQRYFQQVDGLKYDRIVMRGLKVHFSATLCDITPATRYPHWHDPDHTRPHGNLASSFTSCAKPAFTTNPSAPPAATATPCSPPWRWRPLHPARITSTSGMARKLPTR